ncbi:MAG: hypothetical protein ABI186_06665 [Candidatus Elarobacter sp.]
MTFTLVAAIAACKDKDPSHLSRSVGDSLSSAVTTLGDTSPLLNPSGHKYGPPTGKIRVANLLDIDGKPSGPLDFYDVRKPDSSSVPIIKSLEYGKLSDYVSPRAGDPCDDCTSNLYYFSAGVKQATRPFGGSIDNGGFKSTDQLTIAIGPSKGFSGTASAAFITIAEAGKKLDAPHADSETAIQGSGALLIVRDANMHVDSMPEQYLVIDGRCPHAANDFNGSGDKGAYSKQPSTVSNTLLFPIAAGTHTLGVVTSPRGKRLITCSGHAPKSTTSLSVAAGKRYVVWVYGQPSDGVKVLTAPVGAP